MCVLFHGKKWFNLVNLRFNNLMLRLCLGVEMRKASALKFYLRSFLSGF